MSFKNLYWNIEIINLVALLLLYCVHSFCGVQAGWALTENRSFSLVLAVEMPKSFLWSFLSGMFCPFLTPGLIQFQCNFLTTPVCHFIKHLESPRFCYPQQSLHLLIPSLPKRISAYWMCNSLSQCGDKFTPYTSLSMKHLYVLKSCWKFENTVIIQKKIQEF